MHRTCDVPTLRNMPTTTVSLIDYLPTMILLPLPYRTGAVSFVNLDYGITAMCAAA